MATSGPTPFFLTPIDSVMPRAHIPQLYFFPETPGYEVSSMIDTLRSGLRKTVEAMGFLSGTIQTVSQEGIQKGILCVSTPWCTIDDILQVKDLRQSEWMDYRILKDRHFVLDGKDVVSLTPIAAMMKEEKPVMLVQLNIVNGGMIMALCLNHSFTDGAGFTSIARVWAACCRGEDGLRNLTIDMIDRKRLMQGYGSEPLENFDGFPLPPVRNPVPFSRSLTQIFMKALGYLSSFLSRKTTSTDNPQTETGLFFFSKSKLAELKLLGSARGQGEEVDVWISTMDALCALIFCCVHCARDEKLRTKANKSFTMLTAMSMRRLLDPPLPADYIGNVLTFLQCVLPNTEIDSKPEKVAEVARLMRSKIKERDEDYLRKLIGALSSIEDLAKLEPTTQLEGWLGLSSLANQDLYDINWGEAVGSTIERVRMGFAVKNFCLVLPELRNPVFADDDCGLEIEIALDKEQMGRLRQDKLFMGFAQWRSR